MSDPDSFFLKIRNKHHASCGIPPEINNSDKAMYLSYFENEHGEQWVFVGDKVAGTTYIRGGDADWEKTYPVVNGMARINLSETEREWVNACVHAFQFTQYKKKK